VLNNLKEKSILKRKQKLIEYLNNVLSKSDKDSKVFNELYNFFEVEKPITVKSTLF
jgi:hypothetical protein